MDISMDAPINFRWVECQIFSVISPESDPAEAVYIKGKDLTAFRKWLDGDLGRTLTYVEKNIKPNPSNIYENLILLFEHDGPGTPSHKKAKSEIMILKIAVGTERNWNWEKNFADAAM